MLESIIDTVLTILLLLGLPALFVVFVLRGAIIGKPLPVTVLLPGYILAVSSTGLQTVGIILTTAVGSTLGQLFVYFSARRHGLSFIESAPRIHVPDSKIRQAEELFEKYGGTSVFFTNLIPYLSGFIMIPAGIAAYSAVRVATYAFLSRVIYHTAVVVIVVGAVRLLV